MAILQQTGGTLFNNRGSMSVWLGIPANDPWTTNFDYRGSLKTYVQTAYTLTFSTTSPLPDGTNGVAYTGNPIVAISGSGSYTYAVTSGSTPTNVTMASDGTFSGTPSVNGVSNFTVTATDSYGNVGSQAYQITINTPVGGGMTYYMNLLGVGK